MCSRQLVFSDVELSVSTANRHFPESQTPWKGPLLARIFVSKTETEYFIWKWRGRNVCFFKELRAKYGGGMISLLLRNGEGVFLSLEIVCCD